MNNDTKEHEAIEAVVALGSNIGDKVANLDEAVRRLTADGSVRLLERSRDFATPPWGKTDQDWFVNGCMLVSTRLPPHDLLRRCLAVEEEMGRRRSEKWGPRIIDLDVLVYGDKEIADDVLTLPHPHLTKRAFVLAPLADIAPDLVIEGRQVRDWLADIDLDGIAPVGDAPAASENADTR